MSIKSTWIFKYTRLLNAYFKGMQEIQGNNVAGGVAAMLVLFVAAIVLFFFVKWLCIGCKTFIPKHKPRRRKQKTVSWRDQQGDGVGLEDIEGDTPSHRINIFE